MSRNRPLPKELAAKCICPEPGPFSAAAIGNVKQVRGTDCAGESIWSSCSQHGAAKCPVGAQHNAQVSIDGRSDYCRPQRRTTWASSAENTAQSAVDGDKRSGSGAALRAIC